VANPPSEADGEAARGLSEERAAERLAREGANELPSTRRRSWLWIAADAVREPMFLLLLACGIVYVLLGDRAEAAMLLAFVAVVVGITLSQAQKAERTLDTLRELSAYRAIVIRDGRQRTIAARELVCGDLIVVLEGDRVPADAVLLSGTSVSVDESLLTGESAAVRKSVVAPTPERMARPGGIDLPFLFSGTMVVQGKGTARVLATGAATEIGSIGRTLAGVSVEPTRIQRETATVVRRLAITAVLLSAIVALVYGGSRGNWLQAILVGITLAMAILPEELPVVLSVFLGLGSWRIAKKNVLTRRLPAIEMLGSATVLCVDKTGTLTENRMSVVTLSAPDGELCRCDNEATIPDPFHEILEYGVLASHRDPFDPTERAISEALERRLPGSEHIHRDWVLAGEYPLSRTMLAMSRAWARPEERHWVVAAKGAPEAIAGLCRFSSDELAALEKRVSEIASQGLRVLGVARARYRSERLPEAQQEFAFQFVGLIALADPVRPRVPAAIAEAYTAGIRTIVITGDYPATAVSVAKSIGLKYPDRYCTGAQLATMSEAELAAVVADTNIFCRVVPEQKYLLVEALKRNGEIVAMTGDGVNDAPALRAAHVGIAMGARGTDVAREAAALVLLDDDFGSIIEAVKLGRRIFDNLRKAIAFVIAAHIPIVGMSLLPVLFGMPLLLLPIHILFLQLIIDPACSIAFEAEPAEEDIMRRPPRPVDAVLFDRSLLFNAALQGTIVLAATLAIFVVALAIGRDERVARALAFTTMVLASVALLFINRSTGGSFARVIRARNPALLVIALGAFVFLAAALAIAPIRQLFSFQALHGRDFAMLAGAWAISIIGLLALRFLTAALAGGRRASA